MSANLRSYAHAMTSFDHVMKLTNDRASTRKVRMLGLPRPKPLTAEGST